MMRSSQKEKAGLFDMIAYDKAHMLPLNFVISYIVIPLYVIFALGMLGAVGAQLSAGKVVPAAASFFALLLASAALLLGASAANRKAIRSELRRYDLDTSKTESRQVWDFSKNELSLCFDRYGMRVNGELFYYNHLRKLVITDNAARRVTICLLFIDGSDMAMMVPLTAESLKMLSDFQITLENQPVLDHILAHPTEAFTEIYRKGQVDLS